MRFGLRHDGGAVWVVDVESEPQKDIQGPFSNDVLATRWIEGTGQMVLAHARQQEEAAIGATDGTDENAGTDGGTKT